MIRKFRGGRAGVLLVALGATVTLLDAQGPQAPGRSGFRAATGQEAAEFVVPGDARLVARGPARNGLGAVARYRQFIGDAEVLGGQVSIYTDSTGQRTAIIGAHYPGLRPISGARIGPAAAQALAAARRPDLAGEWRTSLMVRPDTARYFYRVEARGLISRWFFWIDAESGAVMNEYDGFTTGSGIGVTGDTKNLAGLTSFGSGVYTMATPRLTTYDARNRQTLPGVLASDANDIWDTAGRTSPGQPAMVDAHFYANVTDAFYQGRHGFNWLAHYPQGMRSSVHVGRNYNNAGWNGTQMVYGDGDGRTFIEFSGDLDVVGHELSHGVTEATGDLIYQNESGALNEAFSDMMGTAIEYYYGSGNWTIGEDITPGTNGLRNMANPNEDGDPSHYADRYTGTSDNGGVHTNSGIANHWFYLLVNGGQNANASRRDGVAVTGVGLDAAEEIVYEGFTALPANANFCAARAATIAVADGNATNVAAAWDEVGVDEALCAGGSDDETPPAITAVASRKLKGTKFQITWTTNEPADSVVTFTGYGSYSNSALVTSHSMSFTGSNGVTYQYYVTSTDASGNSRTEGPFTHQN
jgi:bacillolysin